MAEDLVVDPGTLREQVRDKYREVALDPKRGFHFHTGRALATRLGYDTATIDALPDRAVESFAGVANPFSLRRLEPGERVVDVGSGAGFDSFVAAGLVSSKGWVVLGLAHVEFIEGLADAMPIADGWADVVISNGVINLCADKQAVFAEIRRILRPGGWLQFAEIANGHPVPSEAIQRHRLQSADHFSLQRGLQLQPRSRDPPRTGPATGNRPRRRLPSLVNDAPWILLRTVP